MIQKAAEMILKVLATFMVGLMFLMTISLILTAIVLSIAVAREIYDIYLKDLVWKVKRKIYEILHFQRNNYPRKEKDNLRRLQRTQMSMVYRRILQKKKRREKTGDKCY